eukprot:scaffold6592_cov103-Skeletonema_dohrnii-CCMP3373.AAC.9
MSLVVVEDGGHWGMHFGITIALDPNPQEHRHYPVHSSPLHREQAVIIVRDPNNYSNNNKLQCGI